MKTKLSIISSNAEAKFNASLSAPLATNGLATRSTTVSTKERKKKHMKTITKFIYLAFTVVGLAMGTLTANAAPVDLFESDYLSGTVYKFAPDGTRSTFAS